MSLYTLAAVGGGSIGLILGGVLTQVAQLALDLHRQRPHRRSLTLFVGARSIEENVGIGVADGVDWLGSVLVTGAMMLGVYAIVTAAEHGWGSAHTLGFGAAALVVLALSPRWSAGSRTRSCRHRVLRTPGLVGGSFVRGFMVVGLFGSSSSARSCSSACSATAPVQTGMAFLPQTLSVAALSLGITAALMRRFGARRLIVPGFATAALGLALFALTGPGTAFFPQIFFALMLLGLGPARRSCRS